MMDRIKAKKLLEAFGRPALVNKKNGKAIVFARQDMKDVEEIEKMDGGTLTQRWKNLTYMNYIYGQVSLNEMQRIQLIELEMNTRKNIDATELEDWYEEESKKFKESGGEL